MEWCKQRFTGNQFQFYQGKSEMEDWNQMAGCSAHIIANSSFSWWAAYASGNKTIAPKRWFSDGVSRVSIPEQWTLV
jgi:hypothetical protein